MKPVLNLLAIRLVFSFFCVFISYLPTASAAGWLYTYSEGIYNPDGTRWLAHGVNLADMRNNSQCAPSGIYSDDPREMIRRLKIVASWGANAIRITMETQHTSAGNSEIITNPNYLPAIKSLVDYAAANYPNMYILLAPWHDLTFDSDSLPTTATDPVYQKLVDVFHSYSNVIFGIDNEPVRAPTDQAVWNAMNHAVQTIRTRESSYSSPPHLISVQAKNYTADVSYYVQNRITAGNGLNIIYEPHIYSAAYTNAALAAAANIPVIIGEYGPADPNGMHHFDWAAPGYSGAGQDLFVLDQTAGFAAACRAKKIPFLAWAFSDCDNPSMLFPSSGTQCGSCNANVSFSTTSWGSQVQAELRNPYGPSPTSVAASPNAVSTSASTFRVNPLSVRADGTSSASLFLALKTADGNIISNQKVSVTSSGTNNSIQPATGTTDSNGIFTSQIYSTTPESKTIGARAADSFFSSTVSFLSTQPNSLSISKQFPTDPNTVPANGENTFSVSIRANDKFGKPLANAPISIGLSSSIAYSYSLPNDCTDSNGMYVTSVYDSTPETVVITASIGTDSVAMPVVFRPVFIPDGIANPNSVPADGTSLIWLNILSSDSNGVPGVNQNVYIDCHGGTARPIASTSLGITDVSGTLAVPVYSSVAGTGWCTIGGDDYNSPSSIAVNFTQLGTEKFSIPQRQRLTSQSPNIRVQRIQAAILD